MAGTQGPIDVAQGPFTYWVREVPNDRINQRLRQGYKVGPTRYIMQTDRDGNHYEFAEISPLMSFESIERVMKRLPKK